MIHWRLEGILLVVLWCFGVFRIDAMRFWTRDTKPRPARDRRTPDSPSRAEIDLTLVRPDDAPARLASQTTANSLER